MEKFSIIILHYNQMEYIEGALKSVLTQTYPNVELVIMDDFSKQFDKKKVEEILKKYNQNHFDYKIIANKENIGTVKTINKALKNVTGDYILCFAADDELASNHVLKLYYDSFQKTKCNVITSNWIMCDENLNYIKKYQNSFFLMKYNYLNIKKQYAKMCCYNIYGAGSTCYRKKVFEKNGFFDERYKLIEDWTYWLHLLNNGEKIYYQNFDGLLHRDGGVSATVETKISNTKKIFYEEVLKTIHYEILPNLSIFNAISRFKIIKYYHGHVNNCSKYINVEKEYPKINNLINNDKALKFIWIYDKIRPHAYTKIKNLFKNDIMVLISFILTVVTMFIVTYFFSIKNIILPILISILYFVIYYFGCILKKVFHIKEMR